MVLSQMLISCSKNLEEIRNAKREFAKQIKCKEVIMVNMVKYTFFDITYNDFLAQKYYNVTQERV